MTRAYTSVKEMLELCFRSVVSWMVAMETKAWMCRNSCAVLN